MSGGQQRLRDRNCKIADHVKFGRTRRGAGKSSMGLGEAEEREGLGNYVKPGRRTGGMKVWKKWSLRRKEGGITVLEASKKNFRLMSLEMIGWCWFTFGKKSSRGEGSRSPVSFSQRRTFLGEFT